MPALLQLRKAGAQLELWLLGMLRSQARGAVACMLPPPLTLASQLLTRQALTLTPETMIPDPASLFLPAAQVPPALGRLLPHPRQGVEAGAGGAPHTV